MSRNDTLKPVSGLTLLVALCTPFGAVRGAQDPAAGAPEPVDTSQWKCKYCAFEEGFSGRFDLGLGYVSEDSFKFGEYTGLNEKGPYVIGGADARYRGPDANYLDLSASDLGLVSRSLSVEGGKQGRYKLYLKYDELPHFISDTASTPFRGAGTATLDLPPGWVAAGSTAGMSALAGSLQHVDLDTQRKRLGVGAALMPTTRWQYAVRYRHETKDGMRGAAGAFYFNSAQLIQPVDYVTDQVDASVTYNGSRLQAKLGYYGSTFRNGDESLTWQNPYTQLVAGADRGQLALPPDNQFHQIVLSGGYQATDRTRASAEVALGRMKQNEPFLAVTLNPNLVVPAPPRSSLDGLVDTVTANVKVISAVTDKLRLNAAYTYNDRDNKTPQAAYDWVTTDSFVNAPRTNLPYSFTHTAVNLRADYRLRPATKLGAGYDYDVVKRSFQEIDRTRENTLWAQLGTRFTEVADLRIKYAHSKRNPSGYQAVPEIDPPENPLLRKYNMAERTRNGLGVHAGITPMERLNIGVGVDYAKDNYDQSTLGLTDSRDVNVSADASVLLTERADLSLFLNRQQIRSHQVGSQDFSTPDWSANNNDKIDTVGIGVKYRVIDKKLDVGADYTLSRSRGEISIDTGISNSFPDLYSRLDSVKLYGTYRIKDKLSLRAAYWYEHYTSEDWALDGVTPSTIPNVLSFGQSSPSYNAHVVMLSVQYSI